MHACVASGGVVYDLPEDMTRHLGWERLQVRNCVRGDVWKRHFPGLSCYEENNPVLRAVAPASMGPHSVNRQRPRHGHVIPTPEHSHIQHSTRPAPKRTKQEGQSRSRPAAREPARPANLIAVAQGAKRSDGLHGGMR